MLKDLLGDHDFSGYVSVDDFPIWAKYFGTYPSSWPFVPGNNIDPDNNNQNGVENIDYPHWAGNYGKRYPYQTGSW